MNGIPNQVIGGASGLDPVAVQFTNLGLPGHSAPASGTSAPTSAAQNLAGGMLYASAPLANTNATSTQQRSTTQPSTATCAPSGDRLLAWAAVAQGPNGLAPLRGRATTPRGAPAGAHARARRRAGRQGTAGTGPPARRERDDRPRGVAARISGPGEFVFPQATLSAARATTTARAGNRGAIVLAADRHTTQELWATEPLLLELLATAS